jgi:acyl CoA:acetate/3-ketoacid CoA transferase alpha subunit
MKKLYPDAGAALEGLLTDGMTICAGGFGPVRHSRSG